ncbi:Putative prophage major tail sheath protein [Asticcacaulis sp. MM231]
MPIHHGIKITESGTGTRPIATASTSVIGLVAIASDADDATFPLDTPVLITDVSAAIGKAGVLGTLAKALQAIADQCNPIIVVVRVEEGGSLAETNTALIGTTTSQGQLTGMQALLAAQGKLGVTPKIIGVPGHDNLAVTAAMAAVTQKLRGMCYAQAQGDVISTAILYRANFSQRELMLLWPDFTAWSGEAVARALGVRAKIDALVGWHKSISNYGVNGVTGISRDVHFDMAGVATDAALLNDADITTLIRNEGFKFWGNRTCSDDPLFAFEPAVRTNYVLQDSIAKGLEWAIDKPITAALIKDILKSVNAMFRSLKSQGLIIGAKAWFDATKNPKEALAAGKVAISYDYTPCAPLESLTADANITDVYYADLVNQLAA